MTTTASLALYKRVTPAEMDESPPPVSTHQVVPESPWVKRLWRAAQGAIAMTVAVVGVGIIARVPEMAGVAYGLGAAATAVLGFSSIWKRRSKPDPQASAPLLASEDGVRLGEAPLIPRSEIREASVTPRDVGVRWGPSWLRPKKTAKDEVFEV